MTPDERRILEVTNLVYNIGDANVEKALAAERWATELKTQMANTHPQLEAPDYNELQRHIAAAEAEVKVRREFMKTTGDIKTMLIYKEF